MRVLMQKTGSGALIPAGPDAEEELKKLKQGQPVWCDVVRARHTKFHRKMFVLFGVGFDAWEPQPIADGPYAGITPVKNFDQFRKDITKLAGFTDMHVSPDGSVVVEAKSLAYDSMEADEFERLYSAVIDVLLQVVLRDKTGEDLRQWVDRVMRFDG